MHPPTGREARSGGVPTSRAHAGPAACIAPAGGAAAPRRPPPTGREARGGGASTSRAHAGPAAQPPTPILAAEARWPLGLWPKKFMRSSCGWPWAAWPAGRFGRRVSLSRRAPRIVPISRSARGGPGPLGRSRHRPESRVDPNQCKGNREVAGLVLLAPGSVPTPSQVPSELRPARGQPQDGRVDVLWSPESVPTPSRVPCEPEPVRGQPEVGRFDVPGCGPRRDSHRDLVGVVGRQLRGRRCELSAPRTSVWSQFARFLHDSVRKAPPRRGDCGRRPQPGARSGGCH